MTGAKSKTTTNLSDAGMVLVKAGDTPVRFDESRAYVLVKPSEVPDGPV